MLFILAMTAKILEFEVIFMIRRLIDGIGGGIGRRDDREVVVVVVREGGAIVWWWWWW